jgi:hypothetical protein
MSTDPGVVGGTEAAQILAEAHQARQAAIRSRQVAKILSLYRKINPDQPIRDWINGMGDQVYVLLSTAQEVVAGEAKDYVRDVLAVQGIDADIPDLNPRTFAGIASDGRDLESLLAGAPIRTAARGRAGDSRAVQSGEQWLKMAVDTQISDAGRAADSVAIAAADAKVAEPTAQDATRQELLKRLADARQRLREAEEKKKTQTAPAPDKLSPGRRADVDRRIEEGRKRRAEEARRRREAKTPPQRGKTGSPVRIGWVRMLTPPSCDRCILLAGRWYRWSEGFERHPMCDCRHIPASEADSKDLLTNPEAYFDSLTEQEQDETFGKAHADAIRLGADLGQVVNSHTRRGAVYVADGTEYTFEGTGKRPKRGQRGAILRPTVWQIYREAKGDREVAKQMLRRFRYLAQ